MSVDKRWQRLKELYQTARSLPRSQRDAFLDDACAGDRTLRQEIDSLIESADDSILDKPLPAVLDPGLAIGQSISHYEVVEELGRGGMGIVFRGFDTELHRDVAIKILQDDVGEDPERLERFKREARAASAMNHPNITTIYEIGSEGPTLYMVMELLRGETVRELMLNGPLSEDRIFDLAIQVADGLTKAHEAGIVHRDLKPENLMATDEGIVKILDFGLAKRVRTTGPDRQRRTVERLDTRSGVLLGTVNYMSPEQASEKPVDARSDQFALGVVLYEMATGARPFERDSVAESLAAVLSSEVEPAQRLRRDLPNSLATIINRLLCKSPDDRYESTQALAAELRHARDGGVVDGGSSEPSRERHDKIFGGLPASASSFIGRQEEKEEVARLLVESRLLTLTGSGGCGKSRLALEVARQEQRRFPDGAWWVELASLSDPEFLPHVVAKALGMRQESTAPMVEALGDYLSRRQLLLILDNCEHLIEVCASLVATLLDRCPELVLFTTSREQLAVPGERVWRVPSLGLPGAGASTKEVNRCDSIRLFVERARSTGSSFQATDIENIAGICRRLDGIPLAIELASTRVSVLSLVDIRRRLDERFDLLSRGTRAALTRHQTLHAAIEWGYELLSDSEQRLLRRLSVFAGGWTLDAAESVCAIDPSEKSEILELLSRLVDKSLVLATAVPHRGRRFNLLETVRQYAEDRLLDIESEALQRRHAEYFVDRSAKAEPELVRSSQAQWLSELYGDHGNLRKALELTRHLKGLSDAGLEMSGHLWWYFLKRGHLAEGRQWLETALASSPNAAAASRARGLLGLGVLTYFQGDVEAGESLLSESATVAQEAPDRSILGWTWLAWGNATMELGNIEHALQLFDDAMKLGEEIGDAWIMGVSLHLSGVATRFGLGDCDGSRALIERAVSTMKDVGDLWFLANSTYDLAEIARIQARYDDARQWICQGLNYCRELQDAQVTSWFMDLLAGIAISSGRPERGAELLLASNYLLESIGSERPPTVREPYELHLAACREQLGDDFDTRKGRTVIRTLADALEFAANELD